jgi:hypothetical protein
VALFHYKDREAYERDVEIALALLRGFWGRGENGRYSVQHCSPNTNPTEKEARAALSRVLLSGDVPDLLLLLLAILFTPELSGSVNPVQRKVVFKRLNTGHSNVMTDMVIAALVQHLRNIGSKKATEEVANACRLELRHVKRIYSKHKGSTLNQMVMMVAALVPRTSTDARARASAVASIASMTWVHPKHGESIIPAVDKARSGIRSTNSRHGARSTN